MASPSASSRTRAGARQAFKVVSRLADRATRPAPGFVVLIYHRVQADAAVEMAISPGQFRAQMEYVSSTCNVLRLGDALEPGASRNDPGQPAVIVTFDDGTSDFCEAAVPILVDLEVPVTLYLATDFVERGRPFVHDGRPASWAGLSDAVATGLVDVGSHSHTHPIFSRLSRRRAGDEIDRATGLIEERLSVTPLDFAYPEAAAPSAEAASLVAGKFRSAAVAGSRVNPWDGFNPHELARTPIQRSDSWPDLQRKVSGGGWLEDSARSVRNRIRFRGIDVWPPGYEPLEFGAG